MIQVYEKECESSGLDQKKVESLAKRISKLAIEAHKLGLFIFGGSGSGTLRMHDGSGRPLIIAAIDGEFDGGDGACWLDPQGLMRGE